MWKLDDTWEMCTRWCDSPSWPSLLLWRSFWLPKPMACDAIVPLSSRRNSNLPCFAM